MKILLVDDHALFRDGLRYVLGELADDTVVLETADRRRALRLVEEHADLELIVLDLMLPDGNGLGMLAEVRDRYPALPIVVVSAIDDRETVRQAFALGALGFIPKAASREIMLSALRLIFSGGVYVPPEILAGEAPPIAAFRRQSDAVEPSASPSDLGLSPRQINVLALIIQGKSNKFVCRTLGLAEPTVKKCVSSVLKALNVANRTEAAFIVSERGWKLPEFDEPES